jgi:dolichyl-phosphate-mannose-protein mannosyltransferase
VDVEIKSKLGQLYRWEYFWLCIVVLVTLIMHLSIITTPNSLILDEQHYIKDANYVIDHNQTQRIEHPPLAKLFMVGGIEALGDNAWGWRIPSVLVGSIGIVLFYLICRRLNLSRRAASIAVGLYGFENYTFLLSSLAMLDVYFVTFMFAFFLLYLYRQYVLSGIFIGLSALAKLYAAIATPTLLIHWLFTKTKQTKWFILTVILAPVSFIALMPLCDYVITKHWQNPFIRIKEMISLSGSLTFSNPSSQHPALSRPWEWVLNYKPMDFWYMPHYIGALSPSIWILIMPVVLYLLYRAFKRDEAGLFGVAWFFSTYILWIPASILSDRISFNFYFYPTIGALCLGLGLAINQILNWLFAKQRKTNRFVLTLIILFFIIHAASFVIITPVFFRS